VSDQRANNRLNAHGIPNHRRGRCRRRGPEQLLEDYTRVSQIDRSVIPTCGAE
jgi:hypothetical protein